MSKKSSDPLTAVGENEPDGGAIRVTVPACRSAGYFSKRHRGRRMTLHVTARAWAAAERLARDYAGQDLERVLAAFVGDLAEAAERPGCWERARIGAWLASHPWPRRPEDDLWR